MTKGIVRSKHERRFTSKLGKVGTAGFGLGLTSILVLAMSSPASAACTSDTAGNLSADCTAAVKQLSNGLAFYALLTCTVGILISAAMWALGSKGQNPGQELTGKKGFIVCLTAAFFIGALTPMMSFLDNKAQAVDNEARSMAVAPADAPTKSATAPPTDTADNTNGLSSLGPQLNVVNNVG